MMMIKPATITPANLTSLVPENDAPAWAAGTYKNGDKVISNHHVFESLADSNTADPAKDDPAVPKWLDRGATNRWRMFDKSAGQVVASGTGKVQRRVSQIGVFTANPETIDITITPGSVVTGLALFGLVGYQVTITVNDPVDGVVYGPEVISLVDPSAGDMWEWLFTPVDRIDNLVLTDLPAYGTASIHILIEAGTGGTAQCEAAVVGEVVDLGESIIGASFGITDYSSKDVDTFGTEFVIERGFRNKVTFPIAIWPEQVATFRRLLTEYRARPAVWIGDESLEWTLIYGRYRDLNVVRPHGAFYECTLEIGAL